MGKGEIACYEQYLLFPTGFSKDLNLREVKTRACSGEGVNGTKSRLCGKGITLSQTSPGFYLSAVQVF